MSDKPPKLATLGEALQNGPGTVSSRLIILIVLPALFGFSVWSGERIINHMDELTKQVLDNHVEVLQITGDLKARVTGTEHDIAGMQRELRR